MLTLMKRLPLANVGKTVNTIDSLDDDFVVTVNTYWRFRTA